MYLNKEFLESLLKSIWKPRSMYSFKSEFCPPFYIYIYNTYIWNCILLFSCEDIKIGIIAINKDQVTPIVRICPSFEIYYYYPHNQTKPFTHGEQNIYKSQWSEVRHVHTQIHSQNSLYTHRWFKLEICIICRSIKYISLKCWFSL